MRLAIRIEGDEALARALANPEFVAGPLKDFLKKAGFEVEKEAKLLAPVDTGRMRASITSSVSRTQAVIAPRVDYGAYVEFGTRPHFPPPSALQPWAKRHGFSSAWALAVAIAKRGTKAHPFMFPGARNAMGAIRAHLSNLAREIEQRWGRIG